jgi:ribosomal protein RSM22 (predicted rRNA methylase)
MLMKDAEVPFEDEKFSYVALSRSAADAHAARVLAPPRVGKAAIDAKLCTADGVTEAAIPRRDKTAYAAARRWRWGDAVQLTESRTPASRR